MHKAALPKGILRIQFFSFEDNWEAKAKGGK